MSFREILPLIMAAALGSAATYIAVRPAVPAEAKPAEVEARKAALPVRTIAAAPLSITGRHWKALIAERG